MEEGALKSEPGPKRVGGDCNCGGGSSAVCLGDESVEGAAVLDALAVLFATRGCGCEGGTRGNSSGDANPPSPCSVVGGESNDSCTKGDGGAAGSTPGTSGVPPPPPSCALSILAIIS